MFNFFYRIFCILVLTIYIEGSSLQDPILSLDDLRSSFTIEKDFLITAAGQKHVPYPFKSELHSDLAFILKDLNQSEIIHNAYQNWIYPISLKLAEKEKKAFINTLLDVCLLFGNLQHSPRETFLCALNHKGSITQRWLTEYRIEVDEFIKEANASNYQVTVDNEDQFTIVILTTSCSGGNLSVANALSEHLKSLSDVKIIQIDTEEIAKEIDPMMIATGIYTYEMIYSAIFQKTNDFSVIPNRKKLSREIHRYIPSNFLGVLKEKVSQIRPDLIISTRSYVIDDIALASLGVPFRMMQADFELCPSLKSYYRETSSDAIRFWLFNTQPSMFKSLFETYDHLDLYNSNDSYNIIMEKMALFLQVPLQKLKEQFEVIGYPVASVFFQIQDKQLLKSLKIKWGVNEQETPIFITMGKHGTAAMRKIFEELLHSKTKKKLKFFFICGKNEELESELKQILSRLEASLANRFSVYGLLSSKEMNEIMNICSLGISKAGSAAVLEAMATQGHLLLMHSYPWEEGNGIKLVEMGFGSHFEPTMPLIKQIEKGIDLSENRSLHSLKFRLLKNWQSNLKCKIDVLIRQKKFSILLRKSLSLTEEKPNYLLNLKDENHKTKENM